MQKRSQTLVLGGASWNTMVHLPEFPQPQSQTITNGRFVEGVGSTGIGKAFALRALGLSPTLHVALGDDHLAAKVEATCAQRDIKLIVDRYQGETAQHLNLMDAKGGRISIFRTNGPDKVEVDLARMRPIIASADLIYANLSASTLPLLPLVEASNAMVVADLHDYDGANPWYEPFIKAADIIQLSDEKVADIESLVRRLLSGRASIVVLTKGSKGAEIWQADNRLVVEPVAAQLKDSNGAGDSFCVAFCQSYFSGVPIQEAAKIAAKCAAQTVETDEIAPHGFRI